MTLGWAEPSPSDPSLTGWQYRTKLAGPPAWGAWTGVSGRATRQVVVSPLAHGVRHQFEVRAVNTTGGGPASDIVSASLVQVAFSAAGYTLIESGNPVGSQEVTGQVEDPTQAAQKVQVGVQLTPVPDRRVTIPITVAAGSAEAADYEVRGLPASGGLSFAVGRASKGFTIWANPDADFDDETIQVSFGRPLPVGVGVGSPASATVTLYDTPSAPTGLTAQGGNEQVRLRWDDPGNRGITVWQYQLRRTGGGALWSEWMNMRLSDAQTTEYRVTGLSNGVNYRFKVRAVDSLTVKERHRPFDIENRGLRLLAKVAAGTASGVAFTAIAIGAQAATWENPDPSMPTSGLEGIAFLVYGFLFGSMVGFPIGVSSVDPHDSFVATLMGGVMPGLAGYSLVGAGGGSWVSAIGGMVALCGPFISSLIASEKSRQPPQDRRVSFGLAPTLNGGLSAVTQLRF